MTMHSENSEAGEQSDLELLHDLRKDRPVVGEIAACKLIVDGKEIKADIYYAELEQFVDDHHVAKVTLRKLGKESREYDFTDAAEFTSFLGKSMSLTIEAEATSGRHSTTTMSFVGVVSRIDLENSVHGLNMITVIGHSPTILMDGAKKNAFYRDQTATDIIGSIVGNYQVTKGKIESSKGTLKFSVQYRETDYQYVMRLATGAGLFAYYDGQEFRVTKANSSDVEELNWREELGAFSLGLGTAACEFNTKIYNYEQKKTYSQDTKSLTQQASLSDISKLSPDASKKMYGDAGFSSSAKVVDDAQSLDQVLQSDRNRVMGQMIIGRGQSAIASIASGHAVKIAGMSKMDGMFWVTRVKHVFDPTGGWGYYNIFECTPLDIAYPQYKSARPTITDMQMAVVLDNNDPDKLGRIKVQFPWNDSDETPWVRLMTPHAGKERGWYCLPEIGDEVLVGYEQGLPDYPIALGALYNKENVPPADAVDPDNNVKMFMTKSGNRIVLTDKDGEEKIEIITKDGKNLITMQTGGPTTIESEGAINIKGGDDITFEGANIKLDSKGEITIKSATDTKIEAGTNLNTKASAQFQIEGLTVTVKGNPIQLN
jgi:Rhs element Vgr protein